jgi:hypothetical protein
MGERAGTGEIRVLYIGWTPLPRDYVNELAEAEPSLYLTVTTRYGDVLDILRDGYDCLIIDEKKPQIDATRIACNVRMKGFLSLQIVIRRRRQGPCRKRDEALGVNVLLDAGRDPACAKRLAETVAGLNFTPQSVDVRRDGLPAPIG